MKRKRPAHCKGCMDFHNAGRRNPKGGLEKYNSWCRTFAKPAERAVARCKATGVKRSIPTIQLQQIVKDDVREVRFDNEYTYRMD